MTIDMSNLAEMENSERPTSQLECGVCGKAFARQEHLMRHRLTHTKEKPYNCQQCGKSFSRSDTLSRHMAAHKQSSMSAEGRVSDRACYMCATNRTRCSRELPCSQCHKKGLNCVYPATKRRRINSPDRNTGSVTEIDDEADHSDFQDSIGNAVPTDTYLEPPRSSINILPVHLPDPSLTMTPAGISSNRLNTDAQEDTDENFTPGLQYGTTSVSEYVTQMGNIRAGERYDIVKNVV